MFINERRYELSYFSNDRKKVQVNIESEHIEVVLDEFKNFLLATGWSSEIVKRIQILEEEDMEKLGWND